MAVSQIYQTQLRLVLENGINPDTNEPVYKRKTFNNVKSEATADQLQTVAQSLASLQQLPLAKVERTDHAQIINE